MFDKFAVAHFTDQYIVVANRPANEGIEVAQYASGDTTVGDEMTDFLFFNTKPISKFIVTPLPEFNLYMLTMQYSENGIVKVDQFTFTYDNQKKYGIFVPFGETIETPFKSASYSADATTDLIVAGCAECNEGNGQIYLLDVQTGETLAQTIIGTEQKKVGSYVKIQEDPNSLGWRIWYTTQDRIIAASLVLYGPELVIEDEIFTSQ